MIFAKRLRSLFCIPIRTTIPTLKAYIYICKAHATTFFSILGAVSRAEFKKITARNETLLTVSHYGNSPAIGTLEISIEDDNFGQRSDTHRHTSLDLVKLSTESIYEIETDSSTLKYNANKNYIILNSKLR